MIGKKFRVAANAPRPAGTGHSGDKADQAGRDPDAEIDHGHHQQIAAEVLLDFVENPQRAQPCGMISESQDQRAAQVTPTRDEQDQCRKEQQKFGEGR